MKRFLLILIGVLLVVLAGAYFYLKANLEVVTSAISRAVESATGKPLVLDAPPALSVFPQLGLDVGKARWGDAQKDELSMTFNRAVVRVDFMALLSKRIDVKDVLLESPKLVHKPAARTVAPARPGGSSVSPSAPSAQSTPSAPAGTGAGPAASGEFDPQKWAGMNLDAVRITDGDVRIEQPGLNLHLSKLDVKLSGFAAGKSGNVQLATHVVLREFANKQTEADVAFKTDFVPQHPVVKLSDLVLKLTPVRGLPISKPVAVSGKFDLDTARMTLGGVDVALEFAGSRVQAKGQAAVAGPSGQFAFSVQSALRETLAACGVVVSTQDPKVLGAFDVSGRVKLGGNQIELSELKGKLDDTTLSGNLSGGLNKLSGALKLGSLHVDRYLPGAPSAPAAQAPASAPAPANSAPAASGAPAVAAPKPGKAPSAAEYPEMRLDLAVETLKANNLLITGLKMLIQGKGGQYTADPCTFRFYESPVSLSARAQLIEQQYSLKMTANNLNAGALLKDAAKMDKIVGKVNVQTDLTMRGPDEAAMRRSLSGTSRLTGQLDVDTGLLPADWGQLVRDIRTLNVSGIDVVAKADKGRIALKPITASGQVKVNGQGVVDLPSDALDLRLDAVAAGVTLPLLVRGTLKNPSYGIDPAGAIKSILENPKATQAIEKGVKSLFNKLR